MVNEKLDCAIQSVYSPEEISRSELMAYAQKRSVNQIDGYAQFVLNRQILLEKHHQLHVENKERIRQSVELTDQKKWMRILSSTSATRESSGSIPLLAERDVMIMNGELRGK